MQAAFECFKKAADLGCIKSNTKIAHLYYSGVKAHKFEEFEDEELQDYLSTEGTYVDLNEIKFSVKPDKV